MKKNNKIITIIIFLLLSITILSNFSPNKEIKTIETLPRKPQGAVLDIEVIKVKTEEFKDVFIDRESKVIFVDFSNLQNKAKLRSNVADNSQYEVVLTDAIFSTGDTQLNGKRSVKASLPKILPYEVIKGEEGKAFKIKYETEPEYLYMTIKNKNTNNIEKIYKSSMKTATPYYIINDHDVYNSPNYLAGPRDGVITFKNPTTTTNINKIYNISGTVGSYIYKDSAGNSLNDLINSTVGTLPKREGEHSSFYKDQTTKKNFVRIIKKNGDYYTRDYIAETGHFDTGFLPFTDLKGSPFEIKFFVNNNTGFVSFEIIKYKYENGIDEEIIVEYWNSCYSFWEVKRVPDQRMYSAKFKIKIPPKQQPYPQYFMGFSFLNPIPQSTLENKGIYTMQGSSIGRLNPVTNEFPIHNETGYLFNKSTVVTGVWDGFPIRASFDTPYKIQLYIDSKYKRTLANGNDYNFQEVSTNSNQFTFKVGTQTKFGFGLSTWATYDRDVTEVVDIREVNSDNNIIHSNTTYTIVIPKLNPEVYYETNGTIEKGGLIERKIESNVTEISLGTVKIKEADLALFNNTFKFHKPNEELEFISDDSDPHVVKGEIKLRPKTGSNILENEVVFELGLNEFFQSGKTYLLKGNSGAIGTLKNIINLGIAANGGKLDVFYNLSSRIKIVCENPSFILEYSSNDLDFGKIIEKQFNANEAKATIKMKYDNDSKNKKSNYKIKKEDGTLDTIYQNFKLFLNGLNHPNNTFILSDIWLGNERIPNSKNPEKREIDIHGILKKSGEFDLAGPGMYRNTINIVVTLEESL